MKGSKAPCGNGSYAGNVKGSDLNKGGDMSWRPAPKAPTKTIKVTKGK